MFDFATKFVQDVESNLERVLSTREVEVFGISAENILADGYIYATKDGGKRIRPICVYLGALSTGADVSAKWQGLVDLATMVELIHSYSLVHDDLPAMDNDDYRRGKLSTHKKYGEANGILIGDGLLTKAMEIGLNSAYGENYIKSARAIAKGAMNMVTGQAIDLKDGSKDYTSIYALKTAQLISVSFEAGATYMCAKSEVVEMAKTYGHHIGMAFQIADDLLDGAENSMVNAIGEQRAKELLKAETDKALAMAENMPNREQMQEFATKLLKRKK